MNQRRRILAAAMTLLMSGMLVKGAIASAASQVEARAATEQEVVTVEWLGSQFFRFTSPRGVVVLTSPDLRNADTPITLEQIDWADIILVPNSHNDDMGQPVPIAVRTGATVLAPAPLGRWLVDQGLDQRQLVRAAAGDTREVQGIRIKVLPNPHDNTLVTGADGGPAVSYMITFENGFTAYFFSHSTISMDMQLYGMLYRPHMVLLSINGTIPVSNPLEFAHSVRLLSTENPNLRTVIPQHLRPGDPVIGQARTEMERLGFGGLMFEPEIGVPYPF